MNSTNVELKVLYYFTKFVVKTIKLIYEKGHIYI